MSTDLRKPSLIESIALGGASCVFTVNFTHPIELVKTRMQVSGNGLGATAGSTFAKEGVGAFWKGIVWAWGREGSYASIKLGAYAPVRDAIGAGNKDCEYQNAQFTTSGSFDRNFSFDCFVYCCVHYVYTEIQ